MLRRRLKILAQPVDLVQNEIKIGSKELRLHNLQTKMLE